LVNESGETSENIISDFNKLELSTDKIEIHVKNNPIIKDQKDSKIIDENTIDKINNFSALNDKKENQISKNNFYSLLEKQFSVTEKKREFNSSIENKNNI